jgi:hypothetical protein
MSEKLEQAEAKFDELLVAVKALTETIAEFRKIYQPECVDFGQINELLYNMLSEIDDQMIEENL